jgi:magnesium-protoporphyrin IX monomethyl ester (oxidative) cyclase
LSIFFFCVAGRRSPPPRPAARLTPPPPSASHVLIALSVSPLSVSAHRFFKPKYIVYATYLSEKIGYWRYISIYRHLQRNPDNQLYPIFEYFENWCQDENRHGDFLAAILKAKPEWLAGPVAAFWSRFFTLSVYVTMYLNDHQRSAFYETLGLNTTQFNRHVIIETNNTTARLFPAVPVIDGAFWERMDKLVGLNSELAGGAAGLKKASLLVGFATTLAALFFGKFDKTGSADVEPELAAQY